jgi:hypothetical protein
MTDTITPLMFNVPSPVVEVAPIESPAEMPDDSPAESTLTLADAFPARRSQPKPFYVASQWHIIPGPLPETIEAVNNTTGDRYEGTILDFNDMLRGD